MTNVRRYISVFRRTDDFLQCEIDFVIQPAINVLQDIFGVQNQNQMYDEFPIDEIVAKPLARFTDCNFNFDKYCYFLSCEIY